MADESTPSIDDSEQRQPSEEPDRLAQPVDAEQPPRLPFPVVGIGASAGGLEAVSEFLDAMRPDCGMAFILVQHLSPDRASMMAEILARRTTMPVLQVEDGMSVEPNHVYVIRPGHVLTIHEGRLHLGPPLGTARSANRPIDDFFRSLAEEQRERAVCVVMSGMGSNGTAGAQAIKAVGGLCVAQEPETALFPSMPRHLIDSGYADAILRPAEMPEVLLAYARHAYARGGRESDAAEILEREQHHLREILAILRTRTRQDFSGYKKPTVLRRIQRRMGLTRVTAMADYARLLRQSPAEVMALADDLLIHVTGFFRDPESWEVLRQKVVGPLVNTRDQGASVRAWVTACSSGEEAYSLAMLLVEEADRAGKKLDIKVFATDLADRALAHARAGIYPGGIETEITQDRLERFFSRDDAVYRVRPELRDRVVFAPQNVLQDPPFSRLDIVSCRNLMIYLEPELQQRVLALLHFGLREGGALFLGTSETVAGAEELFEAIDKKARIYRRIGPTRHGSVEFPFPQPLMADDESGGNENSAGGISRLRSRRRDGTRPSIAQLTLQTLLEGHTPPSVTVDRDHRILYYHGDTRPYLQQPTGEPTRDLLLLTREGLRGSVRVALHRAEAENAKVTALDGWVELEPGRRVRIAVTVSPVLVSISLDERARPADFFVISFEERGDIITTFPGDRASTVEEPTNELRRLRAELQSTIEELQTSNEELKASNEEVMSMNEELQSANEELETSKEEMQSLNEELTTVNAQLRAKMEEHQAASSDLASLLASTDIAVLFLDTGFRIRRYTPAVRELLHLIASDVGRPLENLDRKFDDPHLDDDARAVLERLVPLEREVLGANGRHYLRRALPYRTTDNRIDGVVITFVDFTELRHAEEALREREEQFRRAIEDAPIPVIMLAEDGQVLQISRTFTELTGYALADAPTLESWLSRTSGPGADAVRDHVQELFKGRRRSLDLEFAIRTRGGAERDWSFNASAPGTLRDGRTFVVGMAVDITGRKRAEQELRRSEERLRALVTAGSYVLYRMSPDWNEMRRLDGRGFIADTDSPSDDWLQRYIHTDDQPHVMEVIREAVRTKGVFELEHRVLRADGTLGWTLSRAIPILDGNGEITEWFGAASDVTERKEAETALRESEERLRLIVQSATDYGIFTLDSHFRITGWSPGAEAIFGYTESEILGQTAEVFFTSEDRASGAPEQEARTARREGRAADERWQIRKDGSRFYASGVLTRLGDEGTRGFVKVLRDLTDRKHMEDTLRKAHDELEARVVERTVELIRTNEARMELLRRLVRAQEDERRRVSRELHDGLGQELTALILGLKTLEEVIPKGAPGRDQLEEVEASVTRIGREAHDLAFELRPTALDDIGLDSTLATYISQWSERSGVTADFQSPGLGSDRLPPEVETVVYRVVQEALNNVAKHAGAKRASVIVERRGKELTALIEDDGQGFDPARVDPEAGRRRIGLIGMRERVALVGGTLLIESSEGQGTTVRARIPLDRTPEEAGHGG
jgi:PAS domain S-box-containing protein